MPMKTARRRNLSLCDHGSCHVKAHPDHFFFINLRHGKPDLRVSACSPEHLEWMRRGAHEFEVRHGETG